MWKQLVLGAFIAIGAVGFSVESVEAKRLGGGRSLGMQRSTVQPRQATPPTASPQNNSVARPGATPAPAQSGWRRWAAPLAGLAAGLGLAALMSHMGLGAEFGSVLLMILAGVVVFALLRRFVFNKQPAQPAYAGGNPNAYDRNQYGNEVEPTRFDSQSTQGTTATQNRIPAGFDVEGFERQAKVNFIRLQAANDAGNLNDIREFTSPEMFAEIKLDIDERGGKTQQTDVVVINATLLEIAEEANRYVASVRFHGMLREEKDATPESIDEVWHLSKPVSGNFGWTLSGIQQVA